MRVKKKKKEWPEWLEMLIGSSRVIPVVILLPPVDLADEETMQ